MQRDFNFNGFLLFAFVLLSCAEKKEIIPGTSLELALERKEAISNLRYDLFFTIPASQKDSIPSQATLSFDYSNVPSVLQLDFSAPAENAKKIFVNSQVIPLVVENEHILINKKFLREGGNVVRIEFIAGEKALNRNPEYLYTLFVPARASTCFPSFDQPDLKAVYHLELRIPIGWRAVSNGRTVSIDSVEGKKRYNFGDTKPTSTYQFAFAAGKFHQALDNESGMTIYYRETDSVKVAKNLYKIFELHRQSLRWLKEYTHIEYPYEKFDFALIPSFQFGGMEHHGSIFYRESSLFLEPSASVNEELRRASLIAHETAHMWFGNLVTMKWFNDVWLKEVFANFMAAKMVDPGFPEINHKLRFLMAHYPSAYEIDRSDGSHPIQQSLDNLKNAGSVYGAIIYQKAPIMMRNLEALMGEENFQLGLQDYLTSFAYQNATWDDLISALKKHTQQDLEVWNNAWIKTKGMPEVRYTRIPSRNELEINVSNDSQNTIWPQTFYYRLLPKGTATTAEVQIKKGVPSIIPISDSTELNVIPNCNGTGYGYFRSPPAGMEYMLGLVNTLEEPEARAAIWINVWEYVLHGELDAQLVLQKLVSTLEKEKDPLLMEYITDKIGSIFWQFLTAAQRENISAQMDDVLFEQMALRKDNSIKRALFNCYRNVALSTNGIKNLKKFWKDEITLGLELSERDHVQLACELALRQVEGHEIILQEQIKKITNPDRKAEMMFILPALSSDTTVRNNFFESLKDKANRTHEPWVLQAQRYLHHPLRSNYSIRYVKASLELLEEMQKTGDIFFPKGWLDATLGEYQSDEAAQLVRSYLKENAGLRQDLKNKLLQSADMLFRAEQLTKKNQVGARR